MKRCNKCGIVKEETEFYKSSFKKMSGVNGLAGECKQCKKIYEKTRREIKGKEYYANNKERILSVNKRSRDKHKEKRSLIKKEYYKKNSRHIIDKYRGWVKENRERFNERQRKYCTELKDIYLRANLRGKGLSAEQIKNNPELLSIQKSIILIKRHGKERNKNR